MVTIGTATHGTYIDTPRRTNLHALCHPVTAAPPYTCLQGQNHPDNTGLPRNGGSLSGEHQPIVRLTLESDRESEDLPRGVPATYSAPEVSRFAMHTIKDIHHGPGLGLDGVARPVLVGRHVNRADGPCRRVGVPRGNRAHATRDTGLQRAAPLSDCRPTAASMWERRVRVQLYNSG